MENSFEKGDVVELRSGSPAMTVYGVGNGYVECTWYDAMRAEFKQLTFSPTSLQKASPNLPEDNESDPVEDEDLQGYQEE